MKASVNTRPPVRVVIIGRPNVGKSTLFNRLVGFRRALVHNEPGVTRDRLEMSATWWVRGKALDALVVDTGGLGGERFAEDIDRQVRIALSEADCVLLVFDGVAGYAPADHALMVELIKSGLLKRVPVVGVVNKVDAEMHEERVGEFFAAGLERLLTVSAEHDRGIDDLQEAVSQAVGFQFEEHDAGEEEQEKKEELGAQGRERRVPRVAIVGRPNVGKSTLVNALLGRERMITSPIAGTTVDSIDSVVDLDGKLFVFVDTAGIRRKSKTEQGVEVLSVVQARKALEGADLAILLLDGDSGVTDQDEKVGGLIEEAGVSVVLAVNKWDTQRAKKDFTQDMAADIIRSKMGFLKYAPILFMSAKEGKGTEGLGELIDEILHQRRLKVPTHELTEWVRREATIHNPQDAKFYLAHQSGRHPPTFVIHVNDPERVHFSLQRHFVNALRERWGYMGTPLRLLFIEGKNRKSLPKPRKGPASTNAGKRGSPGE